MKEADAAWRAFSERLFDQNKFAIKLGLDSMRVAFREEGDPQRSAPAIIVGGTNGKGGTSARVAAILEAHGLRTGFFSSPHLIELRERFRVQGRPVARDVALRHGRAVLERWGDPDTSEPCLTFFELTTLIAARIFAEAGVDVTIWEVGLGGRLDAVNAIEPAVTVITSIGFDHQKYLGDTIEEIAAEKAALARPDRPVVIGPQTYEEARAVLAAAAPHATEVACDAASTDARNDATALAAAREFLTRIGRPFDDALAARALKEVVWWGRMEERTVEWDGARRTFLIDAAHNPQGARAFFEWLGSREIGAVIFGAMADKDLDGLTRALQGSTTPWFHAQIASPRAASPEVVTASVGRPPVMSAPVAELLGPAVEAAAGQPIAVFGSLYLLGELYDALGFEADDFAIFASAQD